MNNFVIGLKRFFTNKNVVTILLVLVILVALYWGYSSSIKSQTNPIEVPVAAKNIGPQTQITSEMVEYKNIANSMIEGTDAILSANSIIGMYTNVNVTIPKGSVFYASWIASAEDVPGNWIEQLDYEAGELGYYMAVDTDSTLGNSVLPNTYIDIYMTATDENGTIMFGKLMKNVKVLVAHDGSGNNAFGAAGENTTVTRIGFGVSQDMYILLKKAEYLDIELVIAPRGSTVPTKDYVIVTSSTLRDYIDTHTTTVDEEELLEKEEESESDDTTVEEDTASTKTTTKTTDSTKTTTKTKE